MMMMFLLSQIVGTNKILILFLMVTCYLFSRMSVLDCVAAGLLWGHSCVFVFLCSDSVFHQASKTTLISCNYLDQGWNLFISNQSVRKCWQFSQSVVFGLHYILFEWKCFMLITFKCCLGYILVFLTHPLAVVVLIFSLPFQKRGWKDLQLYKSLLNLSELSKMCQVNIFWDWFNIRSSGPYWN